MRYGGVRWHCPRRTHLSPRCNDALISEREEGAGGIRSQDTVPSRPNARTIRGTMPTVLFGAEAPLLGHWLSAFVQYVRIDGLLLNCQSVVEGLQEVPLTMGGDRKGIDVESSHTVGRRHLVRSAWGYPCQVGG